MLNNGIFIQLSPFAKRRDSTHVLMKSQEILNVLQQAERGLTTGEVLQRAEISRPTARRHLEKLSESSKVERWDLPGTYLYFLAEEGEEE